MSATPQTAGVEKALFTSQPPRPRPSPSANASIPAATMAVAGPAPFTSQQAPTTTNAPATAATATSASVLSAERAAKVSTIITDDLRQLSRDDLDLKRWLNATLSRVLEAAKEAPGAPAGAANIPHKSAASSAARKSLQLEEQLVQLLHARVQSHSQELGTSIEDLISNTLVRLPRTTMELSRMSTEAEELTGQLQSIEAIVQPAVHAKSDSYVAQLHTRKAAEAKLRRCTRLLEKAARVQESIRNIQYLIEHREAKLSKPKGETASKADRTKTELEDTNKATATRQRDLDEVAGIIRQAREDLKEITAVDDTFGEQYKAQLEQFEQYIEQALEEECVACLRAHQLERATRLITTLHSIGRADAVLKRYGEQAATQMVEQQDAKLRNASGANRDGENSTAAAAVAKLLHQEIIPDDGAFLSRELAFLSSLVRGAAAAAVPVLTSEAGASPASAALGADANNGGQRPRRTTAAASAEEPTRTSSATTGTPPSSLPKGMLAGSSSGDVEDDPLAAQVLEVLAVLLAKLHAPVHAALQPLLTERADTSNSDFVACFTAIQQLKVSANSSSGAMASSSTSAATVAAATAKDPLEKLAREVTHRALVLFASLFQQEKVLERYAQRVCTPISAFCAQPLTKILASSASAPATPSNKASEEDSLAQVLTQSVQEVLVYVPEKISARCTAAWHVQLSKTLTKQLQPTEETSQHVLLQHLYLLKQRVKPLLVKTQQAVEDWLSSGSVHERYPTGAGLLRADLQGLLWAPLKVEVEEVQRTIQHSILHGIIRPILAKVEAYAALPCWGNAVDTRVAPGEAAARLSGLYTQGQAAPSSAVRDMGEMLMELPLTLETLASTAVVESHHGASQRMGGVGSSSDGGAILLVNDVDAEEGVRMLVDEQAEDWLETVVRDVVRVFLDDTVLRLVIGPFAGVQPSPPSQPSEGQVSESSKEAIGQLYSMALEQLTTDLDYLRNILSAVNEESQETVERVMSALHALPSAQQTRFIVGEAIHMTTSSASTEDDRGTATQSGVYQSASG